MATESGMPFGVLEVDSRTIDAFDEHDIDFLKGFANILAEAVATAARAEDMRTALSRLEQLAEEKEVLSQELRHRVRNSLHVVYGLLNAEIDGEHAEHSILAFRSIAPRDHAPGPGVADRFTIILVR